MYEYVEFRVFLDFLPKCILLHFKQSSKISIRNDADSNFAWAKP